jgi:hypothetical protein
MARKPSGVRKCDRAAIASFRRRRSSLRTPQAAARPYTLSVTSRADLWSPLLAASPRVRERRGGGS